MTRTFASGRAGSIGRGVPDDTGFQSTDEGRVRVNAAGALEVGEHGRFRGAALVAPAGVETVDVGPDQAFSDWQAALLWAGRHVAAARDAQETAIVVQLRADLGWTPSPLHIRNALLGHVRIDAVYDPARIDPDGEPYIRVPVATLTASPIQNPEDTDPEEDEFASWRYLMRFSNCQIPYLNARFFCDDSNFTSDGMVVGSDGVRYRTHGVGIAGSSTGSWPRRASGFTAAFKGFHSGIVVSAGASVSLGSTDTRQCWQWGIRASRGARLDLHGGRTTGVLSATGAVVSVHTGGPTPGGPSQPFVAARARGSFDYDVVQGGVLMFGWGRNAGGILGKVGDRRTNRVTERGLIFDPVSETNWIGRGWPLATLPPADEAEGALAYRDGLPPVYSDGTAWRALVEARQLTAADYASRAAFQAATVPNHIQRWSVLHAGRLLRYVRDPAGTAIESANGVKGSPEGEITPQHFGAVAGISNNLDPNTWELDQAGVQAAIDWAAPIKGAVRLHGGYRINQIVVPRGIAIRGETYDRADNFFDTSGDGLFLRSSSALEPGDAAVVMEPDPTGWATHEGRLIGIWVHGNGDTNPGVHGVLVNSAKAALLQRCIVTRCSGDAVRIANETGGGTSRTANGVRIWDTRIINNYGDGINFLGGGESEVSRCYIGNNSGTGLRAVAGISVNGGIIADSGENGMVLTNRGNTLISGVKIQDNLRNGIVLLGATGPIRSLAITGCMIADNGVDTENADAQRCGIRIEGADAGEIAITGNFIGNRRKPGDPQFSLTQQYGVLAVADTARITQAGNAWGGNVVADLEGTARKNFGQHIGRVTTDAGFLHRFDEGAFTPDLVFSGGGDGVTYQRQSGSYTIIGDRLFFTCELFLSSKGTASGNIRAVLPMAPPPASEGYEDRCALTVYVNNMATGLTVMGTTEPGAATARIDKVESWGASRALTASDLTDTSILRISGQYPVV